MIVLLFVITFVARPKSSYDFASHNFISNNPILFEDKITNGVSRWMEDYGHSVKPVMCHSHNDYWRPYPLFSALAAGCTGIEADVWLAEDGETLLVGHDKKSLRKERTLDRMYLDPLFEILEKRNPGEQWENNTVYDRAAGVFQTQPNATVVLMVDVKSEPVETWRVILERLERFRAPEKRYLSRHERVFLTPDIMELQEFWPSAITVVGSGNVDIDTIPACYVKPASVDPVTRKSGHSSYYDYHDTFLDAPLEILPESNSWWHLPNGSSVHHMKFSPENSYYASVSFQQSIGSVRTGFSKKQLFKLRTQIRTAKESGLVTRYWKLLNWPINYRDYVWQILVKEGVGMLNVDDVESAARWSWTTGYIRDVVWMSSVSVWVFICTITGTWLECRKVRRLERLQRQG